MPNIWVNDVFIGFLKDCGCDCMIVGFITTYAISAFHH